jgi:hypothetical protein
MSGAEMRSVGTIVFKGLNRNGRRIHRDDLLVGPARYGDLKIDTLAFASTASRQDDCETSDSYDLMVRHRSLPRDVIV